MRKKKASSQKENESEALRKCESWLRLIMENTSDGINISEYDPQTDKRRLVICNDRYAEISGRSREELMAADDINQFVAWYPSRGQSFSKEILKGLPLKGEASWLRPDGKENFFEWTASPLKADGKYRIIGIDRDITDRKKAEERLRRLAMITEQGGEGVALVDLDEILQFVNAAWAKMHGYETGRELIGKHMSLFHTPEQMKTDVIPFNKEVKRKGHHKGQIWHIRRDGTPFPTEMTVNLFKDEGGNPIGLAAFVIDITDRLQVEEALQASEVQYRSTLDSMGDAIHVVDKDMRIVLCNPALEQWCRQLGLESHPVGMTVFEAFPFLSEEVRDEYHHVFQSGKTLVREETLTIDDEEFHTEARKIPILKKGKVVQIVTVLRNITERKRTEEALRESESKHRFLFENLPQMIFYKDRNSVYVSCNKNFARILKTKSDEISGKTDYDFFPKKLADKYRTDDKRIMASGKPEDIEEKFLGVGEEKDIFVHVVKTPIKDAKGNAVGILSIFWDITEHKKAKEALLESEETARALLNATQDLALMIDPDGTILAMNDIAAAKEFQKAPSELIGKNVHDTDRSDLVEHRLAQSDKVFRSGKSLHFEDEHDGIYLDHSVYPIFDSEGRVVRLAIFARDVTESKKAEEALRNSEFDLRKRVRELNCLYNVTEVINKCSDSLDDLLQGIVNILPEACRHPESACARITVSGKKYQTGNFRKSQKKLATDILVAGEKVGVVEVFCLKKSPPADESPFLKEERSLIDTVAARIGRNIERIQTRRQLLAGQSALEQKNVALREVMAGIQDEKKELGRRVVSNVEKIIMPLLYTLEQEIPQAQRKYLDLLKGSLEDVTLPFTDRLSRQFASLTSTEIRICNLIRTGLSTKEIAGLQHVSPATVKKHREHIRRKLQIMNKDVNLATYIENYMSGHAGN